MIYENATIITVDQERRIIQDGSIAVSGNRIVGVGRRESIRDQFSTDALRVDLRGMLVFPGLVDTHVHLAQSLLRGTADEMNFPEWLTERIWPLLGNFDEDDGRISAELCILEMLKAGTTAFVETLISGHYGFDGIAQVVEHSGIRGALPRIVMDRPSYSSDREMYESHAEDGAECLRHAVEMHKRWHGAADDRIQVWFGPRPPDACSVDLYKEMMEIATERDMRVAIHMAEEKGRVQYIRDTFGMSPIEFIESVGMIGPNVLLVHCVNLKEDDIRRVGETGTHIAHCPAANASLGFGVAPVPEFLDAGVNVSLGSDGAPTNNTNSVFRDMRWAASLHKANVRDATVVPANVVLEMATINGAKTMGLEHEIGSLEVGKKADFVAIDMNQPHLIPSPDPVSTLVYCASGQDVHTVVIDGKMIVVGREVLTMDQGRILQEATERASRLFERALPPEVTARWTT